MGNVKGLDFSIVVREGLFLSVTAEPRPTGSEKGSREMSRGRTFQEEQGPEAAGAEWVHRMPRMVWSEQREHPGHCNTQHTKA